MRRACPTCGADVREDDRGVRCPTHGPLQAWLVVDAEGRLVGAGTAGAAWLSPSHPFTAIPSLRAAAVA